MFVARRDFLRLMAASALVTVESRGVRAAVNTVTFSTWYIQGRSEYLAPFEKETGIKVNHSLLTSDDAQFAALKAHQVTNWDIINLTLAVVPRYIHASLVKPIDVAKIPNYKYLYKTFATSPLTRQGDKVFAVPYLWGLNPLVYRVDKYSEEPTYATLFDKKYAGQLAMRDDALESMSIAGLYIGVPRDRVFSMDDRELAEVKRALIAQKPLLRTYWQTIGDLTNLFATGEVTCSYSWRVPYDELKGKLKMGMAKPKAGVIGWASCVGIPADLSDDKTAVALELANYLLGPEYARRIAEKDHMATASSIIRDKFSPAMQATIFIDDLSIMDTFLWPVAPPNYSTWLRIWNEVRVS